MKIAFIIIRILMGLMFMFASVAYFFKLYPQPVLHGNIKIFMEGVTASVYLMPLVKITELICAIAFLIGRYVSLAAVVIFPIIINILLVHIYLDPSGTPLAIALLLADLFIACYYRQNYATLFNAK
ncbi:hypothetical protein [Mucilaginibacter paludis]|uniref:DoxX family protein n=1 Tax=Mucilaginibacter paludis DSM 18603 TaxID=714943 RepID=H1YB76_9SPHI|nr:hypothetical protein [Mucilaginibacter paludis]EHQ30602.1 DoxX family protein [Mucilaginibacter paludis DSM 18603]